MFRADDRAVSEQVGMILMFGFLVVSMATYQATVVPQANHEVEFTHSQEVQADLMELHAALDRAAATDNPSTVPVALGTQYPQRTFFVNPPNPSGRLSTTDARYVGLINAEADGEAGDFWRAANYGDIGDVVRDDRPPEAARNTEGWWIHPHRGIEYEPNYHATAGDRYTVVDPPGFYSEFDGSVVQRASRSPVEGRQIRLLLVDGSLSTASSGTENVDVRPISADTRTVTVEGGDDDPIILHYPTELPKSEWRNILGKENNPDQKNVQYWNYHTYDGQNYVYLIMREENADGERIRYELSLTKVGVGPGVSEEPPAYAVDVAGDGASVPEDGTQRVVVEVRDAYNGPVSGVDVSVQDDPSHGTLYAASGSPGDETAVTDEHGRAAFTYEPSDVSSTTADSFALGFGDDDAEKATYDVQIRDGGSGYAVGWEYDTIDDQTGISCDAARATCTVDSSAAGSKIDVTAGTVPERSQVFVDMSSRDTKVARFSRSSDGNTNSDGELTRELTLSDAGSTTVYASTTSGTAELTLRIKDGAYYRYYEGDYGASPMPDFASETPTKTGYVPTFDIAPREREDEFAFQYTASLTVPSDGTYTFYTKSDDGSELYVDGTRVVSNTGDHGAREESGTIHLTAGTHDIRVAYYENSGDQELTVSWKKPGGSKTEIPASVLDPRKPDDGE
ncbi:PA14 domain-containing protein [Halobium palmae]|uniref:PA14 domain-containing protein n=1 Tax=Halobium palmae TaxID=1776492 RepID=A0ABD5RYZ7_9EURY